VNKFVRIVVLCVVISSVLSPALVFAAAAADEADEVKELVTVGKELAPALEKVERVMGVDMGVAIGAGVAAAGGGVGIGLLSASVVEASARQPEMQTKLMTTMFIAAALIEGLALFAIVVCLLCLFM